MAGVTVATAPVLARVPGVELVQTGTWMLKSGPCTFTTDDFVAAVAALECPAVRRPVLKLGHDGNHGVGQPALGYIDNLAVSDNFRTLIGDYAGMPGWLAAVDDQGQSVLASAYPDRSIEADHNFTCQMGHTHPFVIHAVALLGADRPGVGSIESLADLAALYGVEGVSDLPIAASVPTDTTVTASERKPMSDPAARQVTATVSADDVRRAFYESPVGSSWDAWIEEIQLDPLQVIYIDDDEGARYRIPITIGIGDGPDAVSFGDAVKVVIRYDDAAVAASVGQDPIRWATRAESRPVAAGDPPTPAEPPVSPPTPKGAAAMADTEIKGLRERLGLPEDADQAAIDAKVDELLELATKPDEPVVPSPPVVPDGSVVIDSDVLEELRIAASAGAEARSIQLRDERDSTIAAAVRGGHIAPARRAHWATKWDADPEGVAASIAELTKGEPIYPVTAAGYVSGSDNIDDEDALYKQLFPDTEKASV